MANKNTFLGRRGKAVNREYIRGRLMNLLWNVLSGGARDEKDIEVSRKIAVGNALSIIGIIILIPMGFIGFAQNKPVLLFTDLMVAAFLLACMYYWRRIGNISLLPLLIIISFLAVFYYYLFVSGGVENTAFVWIYTFPLLACFALGSRTGCRASLIFFLFLLAFMFLDDRFPDAARYTWSFKIRLIASYLVVSFFAFAFEKMRELSQSRLEEKNRELLDSLERLRIMGEDLRRAGDELEQRVADRTAELTVINRQLIRETEERKRSEKALRESEEKYRYLVANAPAGIYEMDLTSQRFLSVNDVMCRLSGFTREEFLLLNPIQLLTEESRKIFIKRMEALFAGRPVPADVEFEARGKDGKLFYILLNSRYSQEPDGHIKATVVVQDITERRRMEAERIELERQLLKAQKMESLGILAGGIAHDFNNLLMAILGNLEMAQINLPATSSARSSIGQAMQATRRATDLTRQMLAYSGKGNFLITPMDLNELVRENGEILRTAVCRTADIILQLTPECALIKADPGQVQQVVMNLIVNASEAIGERHGNITLITEILDCDEKFLRQSLIQEKAPTGRYVSLKVADDGAGMSGEIIQRIFDPFFTTKFTGRGLGMPVVMGIVRGHKGAIIIDSEPGRGTVVQILFPVCEETIRAVNVPAVTTTAPLSSGTIMIVDDEEMVRSVCTSIVEFMGFTALKAADGEEALLILQKNSAEIILVLLDLTMPKMDGFHTFREIRRMCPDLPVILCSGYGEEEATRQFAHLGLNGFIKKPFHLRELREKISAILENPESVASRGL